MTPRDRRLPVGAELHPDGVHFRVWAPLARRVDVVFGDHDPARGDFEELPLEAERGGWFSGLAPGLRAGALYRLRLDGGDLLPDPASRFQPEGPHGASQVVDPRAFRWSDQGWNGVDLQALVFYELHLGTFTPEGDWRGAAARLPELADLGVTAIEVLPVAEFTGRFGWGYDGVDLFAPTRLYGAPDDMRAFVDRAHGLGLGVILDVVYNHFGPEGNYLHAYAEPFFNPHHHTPWGAAINFDAEGSRTVRDFFIHNALYWLEEYGFDGLRVDAVHAIADDSRPDFVAELAETVRARAGGDRHVHLVLENDRNQARYLRRDAALRPVQATAQWNDDVHHAVHVLVTGERDGYYRDYAERPRAHLARCLAEGFAYQGEVSAFRGNAPRGEPSAALPPTAFVSFIQTHDQVGNRARGERIGRIANPRRLRAALACLLLAPAPPLLFMGEEFAASTPFLFFCDFGPELAAAVTRGRRAEFEPFERFRDPAAPSAIPDPNDPETFAHSKLAWDELDRPAHGEWRALYRELLSLRHRHVVPRLARMRAGGAYSVRDNALMRVDWTLGDGSGLHLLANLSDAPCGGCEVLPGRVIYASTPPAADGPATRSVPAGLSAWTVVFTLDEAA